MQILEHYRESLILLTVLFFTESSLAARTKRQIIFEDNSDENRVFTANCRTPDRRPGRCIRLTSCSALLQTVQRHRLRRYFCGFEYDEPKVCCPQPMIREVTPPRPAIRTTVRTTARTTARTTRRPTTGATIRFVDDGRNAPPRPSETRPTRVTSSTRPMVNSMTKPPFLPKSCGIAKYLATRVVGGSVANKGDWPWMAIVFVRRNNALVPDCGGALVTDRHVVTAAHCVVTGRRSTPLDPSRIVVRLGAYNLTVPNERDAIDIEVESVRPHEEFQSRTYKNDIAVLKLKRPVTFTKTISPVCLPYDSLRGDELLSKRVYVIGYGTTAFNGKSSDVLMQAGFDVQSQEVCKRAYEPEVPISNVYMCAGMLDGSKDACQGDSGGPLMAVGKNSSYYLVGVVSFGKQCGQPNYPGVYTRITEYLDWLRKNLSD